MVKILVVEDEYNLRKAIVKTLETEGFSVSEACDGEDALDLFFNEHFDLIVTDIMMPNIDGNELVLEIRKTDKDVPIIMLTALDTLDDKISGFRSGTDDYLVKPISMRELVVRIKAMMRRMKINLEQKIVLANTTLDMKTQQLLVNKKEVHLNKKQFQLLFKLLSSPDTLFSREQLLDEIWGYESDSSARTVDTHISWLRKKVESPDFEIISVWGLGYKVVLK